jgi:lipopolysaccharide biosynthesis glycosyltransferase
MKNFLYCFDFNYNIQGFCSIYSLLENTNEPINIHIIHKDPKLFINLKSKLERHPKLNAIKVYKFNDYSYDFPNIANQHVSEATYYRLFISNYIPRDIQYLFYIDADAFFIDKIDNELESVYSEFKNSKYSLAAHSTNGVLNDKSSEELNLKSRRYFNAGILFIDYKKWIEEDYLTSLTMILQNKELNFQSWDQDILNIFFDGNYFELNQNLNFNINKVESSAELNQKFNHGEITIIHYIGSPKPWNIKGLIYPGKEIFNSIFRELFNAKYFLSINNRKNALITLKNIVLNKRNLYLSNYFDLLKEIIISLILKKELNIKRKIKKLIN